MDMVKNIWKDPIVDREQDENDKDNVDIYVLKDDEMDKFSDEYAYALDKNGEGPFMLYAKKCPLLQGEYRVVSYNEPKRLRGFKPYDEMLNDVISLIDVFQYSLILPEIIEESDFCKNIYDEFLRILKSKE